MKYYRLVLVIVGGSGRGCGRAQDQATFTIGTAARRAAESYRHDKPRGACGIDIPVFHGAKPGPVLALVSVPMALVHLHPRAGEIDRSLIGEIFVL